MKHKHRNEHTFNQSRFTAEMSDTKKKNYTHTEEYENENNTYGISLTDKHTAIEM